MNRIDPNYLQHERPIAGVINKPHIRQNRSLGYDEVRLHVSDLMKVAADSKFCEREHVIRKLMNPIVPVKALSASFQLLFDLGNALHDSARNRWMHFDEHGKKRVLARWHCPCKTTHHVGVNPDAIICKVCKFPANHFDEFEIYDPQLHIVAHPDFTIVRGKRVIESGNFDPATDMIRIVEIKGIARKDLNWYKFDAPLGEHTLQGDFYYHLAKRAGFRVDKTISYLYGDRNLEHTLFRNEPWKEFEVAAGPVERVEKFFRKAQSVLDHIEEELVPARKICDSVTCTRAKNCSLAPICFGMPADAHKKATKAKIKKGPKSRRLQPLSI